MALVRNITILTLGACGLAACGAPTKSAGDVAGIFSGESASLDDKTQKLCDALNARTESPSVKDLSMSLGSCGNAGTSALNYGLIGTENYPDGFHFVDVAGGGGESGKDLIRKTMRGQVWLNKSLLGFAQAVASKMKSNEGLETGELNLPDSSGGRDMTGLVTPKLTVLEKPKFDLESLAFAMKINLKISGIVNADHDIAIDGRLIDDAIAVTVRTTADKTYKESIAKKFTAALLIVPYASDVYVDIFADIEVHNPGFAAAVEDNVTKFLGSGLKSAMDSLISL